MLFISAIVLCGNASASSDAYTTYYSAPNTISSTNNGFSNADNTLAKKTTGIEQNTEDRTQKTADTLISTQDNQKMSLRLGNSNIINSYSLTNNLSSKDIKEFGAVGDGVTDDTKAISNAILSGYNIHFSKGKYVVSSTISINGLDNLILDGDNATITTNTTDLEFMFSFNNCKNLQITGIDFDSNNKGRSILNFYGCPNTVIKDCKFHDLKQEEDYTGNLRHVLKFANSPEVIVTGNYFYNIGQNIIESGNYPQYRCITLNSGCNGTIIENNTMYDVDQGLVVAEYNTWNTGNSYIIGNKVLYTSDNSINLYRCIQNHISNSINPTNTSYWILESSNIKPNYNTVFNNNTLKKIIDNGIYFLEYSKNIIIENNTFEEMKDEPVVIVGKNADIINNYFHNWSNKAIAIGTKDNIEKIKISNNLFLQDSPNLGNFIVFRNTTMTYSVYQMDITNNIFKISDSIGAASLILLGKVTYLNIINNTFQTNCGKYEKIIRVSNTVTNGLITGNTFKTTNKDAYIIYDESSGSNIKLFNNAYIILPTVFSIDPANNTTINKSIKLITITLNKPVKAGSTFNKITVTTNDGFVPISTSISTSGWYLYIKISNGFYPDAKYTIILPKGSISDLAGNELLNNYSSTFTVNTSPIIQNIDPANNTINVPINKIITITFSEPVKTGPNFNKITVKKSNGAIAPITVSISASGWYLYIKRSGS